MIETHYRSKRAHARVLIDKFGASFTAEEIANMNKAIAEADQYRASQGRELTDIKWEQVAERPRNGTVLTVPALLPGPVVGRSARHD